MSKYRYQNGWQNHNIKMANRSFENVTKFRYLGMILINQNLVHEEIRSKLNTCYYSVKGLLPSWLLSKIKKKN